NSTGSCRVSSGRALLLHAVVPSIEERSLFCIHSHGGVARDVNPDVNVGSAAEKPGKGGSRQSPVVPLILAGEITVLVKRQGTLIEATHFLQALPDSVLIFFSERLDQRLQNELQLLLLVLGHFGHRNSRLAFMKAGEGNSRLL